ncbi:MAG: hypothetical protein HC805_03875 [Alkalinema sp. RL_2_19]|nr:hypothetical protein [Alkalinema sp. RL_2_19]
MQPSPADNQNIDNCNVDGGTASNTDPTSIPEYSLKLREVLSVGIGAALIVTFALWELANQFFTKVKNPEQAESIIKTVIEYEMPGGSQGLKSFKTNTEAFALVGNRRQSPDLLLLVSQALIEKDEVEGPKNLADELDIPAALVGTWQTVTTNTENKRFCDQIIPVTVRQGSYRMIESPSKLVKMREYMIVRPQKRNQTSIQLFAIGPDAAKQMDTVFNSFKCPQPE